jgi:hypothetical protein
MAIAGEPHRPWTEAATFEAASYLHALMTHCGERAPQDRA